MDTVVHIVNSMTTTTQRMEVKRVVSAISDSVELMSSDSVEPMSPSHSVCHDVQCVDK